jgi:hypothetical protein
LKPYTSEDYFTCGSNFTISSYPLTCYGEDADSVNKTCNNGRCTKIDNCGNLKIQKNKKKKEKKLKKL